MLITKKSIALACSALLAFSAAFAQEAGSGVTAAVTASKASAMEIRGDGQVALHGTDYDGIKGLWVDFHGEEWAKVKWSSSNIKVLKVDQKGRLFPRALGKVTVTAATKDGRSTSREIEVTKYGPAPQSGGMELELGLSGEAGVTFGTDLDSGKSGFSSYQDIDLKLKVLNVGEIWSDNSEGLPIWGEIRVVLDGDPVRFMVDSPAGTDLYHNSGSYSIEIDRAAIHFGPGHVTLWDRNDWNLGYVNYTTGSDVAYSFMGANTDVRYGRMIKKPLQSYLSSYDADQKVYGLSAGYVMDGIFSVDADVASTLKWSAGNDDPSVDTAEKDATDWLYKVSGHLLMLPDFDLQLGYSNGVLGSDSVKQRDMRFGAQLDYQWDFYDIYYLKPSLGVTFVQQENRGDAMPLISGGIMLGWEDKQSAFDYWSTKYDEDDHGAFPGIALNFQYADAALAAKSIFLNSAVSDLDHDVLVLHGSFNTGDGLLVDNLQAVGAVDIIDATSDSAIIGATVGIKYWTPVAGKFSIEPRALITRYYDLEDDANDYMFAKACLCLNYGKAHIELNWESNDLIHGFLNSASNEIGYKGKFEITAKVAW